MSPESLEFRAPEKITTTEKEKKEPINDVWYERLQEIASFEDYEYLDGDKAHREKQKELFLSGEIENPNLDYPLLEKFDFAETEAHLLNLKFDILKNESNGVVKQAYRWRINEKIAELRMLQVAQTGDGPRFLRYSKYIYGEPQEDIYEYTISQIKKVVNAKLFSADSEIDAAAKRVNAELFETFMNNETSIDAKNMGLPKVKSQRNEKEFGADEIKSAFEEALVKYNVVGWNVIISESSKKGISTEQSSKNVLIPKDRLVKETKLKALIEHEIGTHVLRREQGERSKLKILGIGLDRYLRGEEGVATFREQSIRGASEFAGLDGHLAIALALGIDGKKRNFRQVFEILRDFYFIKSKKEKTEALDSANKSAWDRCVRTFRGTSCEKPGVCFTRDIVYREGNIGIWTLSKENSPELGRISIGKYDPNNPRHIWILDQLGITNKDLEELNGEAEK